MSAPATRLFGGQTMTKPLRRVLVRPPSATGLAQAGIPVAATLEGLQRVDGGDTIWLDETTLLAGRGYRTNDHGIHALQAALAEVAVLAFDLPHLHGSQVVLHLLSLLSPL